MINQNKIVFTIFFVLVCACLITPAWATSFSPGVIFQTDDVSYYINTNYNFTNITVYPDSLFIDGGNLTIYPESYANVTLNSLGSNYFNFTNNVTLTNMSIDNGFANFTVTNNMNYVLHISGGDMYQSVVASNSKINYTIIPSNSYHVRNNSAPVLSLIGSKTVNEADLLTFTLSSTDTDSDVMNYTKDSSKGNLNINTGVFTWTPEYWEQGTYDIKFNVTDGYGGYDNETISIVVVDRSPPVSGGGYTVSTTTPISVVNKVEPLINISNITSTSFMVNVKNNMQEEQEYDITLRLTNKTFNILEKSNQILLTIEANSSKQIKFIYDELNDGKYTIDVIIKYGIIYQCKESVNFTVSNDIISFLDSNYDTRIEIPDNIIMILGFVGVLLVVILFDKGVRKK